MYMCYSPWLIAACRVLLRLLVPRHSPCALSNLTFRSAPFYKSVAPRDPSRGFGSLFLVVYPRHLFEDFLLRLAFYNTIPSFCFVLCLCKTSFFFSLSCLFLYAVFKVHCFAVLSCCEGETGGLKWTRTIDLTLIRRAL